MKYDGWTLAPFWNAAVETEAVRAEDRDSPDGDIGGHHAGTA